MEQPAPAHWWKTGILQKMFDEGVIYIRDILSVNRKLLPCNFFRAKGLNFNDYVLLTGLSKALPDSWRNLLNNSVVYNSAANSVKERERILELSLQLNNETVNVSLLTYQKAWYTGIWSHKHAYLPLLCMFMMIYIQTTKLIET